MNKDRFLEKAHNIHGYKYEYIDLPNKIILSDKIRLKYNNNLFLQTVSKHLEGRCPEKNIPIKTTKDFIKECEEVWGNKYDYSLVEYTGALNKIKIIFNGFIYEQRASSHLNGVIPERKNTNLNDIEFEIVDFLNRNSIDFLKGFKLDNIEFDFYVPSMVTCIEIDNINNKIKSDYCEENYINLIRIKYDQIEKIPEILYENLKVFINMKNKKIN